MKLPVRSEIMESLVQERKENQREEKLLQEEIDRILKAKSTSQSAEELDELNKRLQSCRTRRRTCSGNGKICVLWPER